MALPEKDTPNMLDDIQLRELTCDPKHRRVLITDGRSPVGLAMAAVLADAGCSIVFVGVAETWRRDDDLAALEAMKHVEIMPLDLTDTVSVNELCGEIGGKVDILINTADYVRPGGVVTRPSVVTAKDEFEINCFGLMRLAQSFGAAMAARGADGVNSAVAWVNVLSVFALSNWPEFGTHSASHAAAYSISQCLRSELRQGGIRVLNVFTGPVDDDWRQPLPPPKVAPERIAKMILEGLIRGVEDVWVGDVAADIKERWTANPKVLERELTAI
jgi:short-subunit dehydrogenase